ncbi:phage holin family protein [Pseudomonas nitroreducens]|uniref:phage holin family protein n=1 Tax=Pseudomonas nitroreducens TaxID=46680 RepID=UPI00351D6464
MIAMVGMVDPWALVAALICSAICVRIASYRRRGARYRAGVSLLAYLLSVGSGCYSLTFFLDVLRGHPHYSLSPWLLIILAVLAVLVFKARGNVARIVRIDWSEHWDGVDRRRHP